jgi:hypothetical protein
VGTVQRLAAKYWWVAVIVLASWYALNQHDKRVASEARVELVLKELKPLQDQAEVAYKMIAVNDSFREREQVRITAQAEQQMLKVNQVRIANNNQIEFLRQQLDSASKVRLDTIVVNYERMLALKDSQLIAAKKIDELRLQAIAERDSVISDQRRLIDKLNESLVVVAKASNKSLVDKVLPYVAVGAAVVTVVHK